ncbi:flagellar basal-body rod protein FlgF [Roseibium denhamense]|uniref:Flagellar basal-body rod protein FlgF n=1 Tax=Roseibium denhamense TaxID=76305 RepID=A0ABY1PEJ9_9HYPH|nr:flagellar basal-body rod protein FlgF [Roseibium denhamense]MTI06219.1 flagellar basal-body rod protein FlgF [Roseibium denhamense]SMP32685.1 flagellar basal-body rod protein FlgF [Roseibium denhamense]
MQSALYVALSAQVALSNRLETVSRNVANMNTAGYRADEVKFSEYVSNAAQDQVSFATAGEIYISRQGGSINKTDNPLDLAIDGEAWFAIRDANGVISYTRDGRLHMTEDGALETVTGQQILGAGGQGIVLNPEAGTPLITENGEVVQGEDGIVGQIGLFLIPEDAKLTRQENSAVIPDQAAIPVQVFDENAVKQGYVEGANINPIREMTKMIMISRAFESATKMIEKGDESQQKAIRELGASS